MSLLLVGSVRADKLALVALEDDGRALVLMRKQLLVGQYLGTALLLVAAFELQFA